MQEYYFDMVGAGKNGLVPNPLYPPGADYASSMRNLRPSEAIAINPEWFTCPFAFTLDWPYPIIERGENVTLLLKRAAIATLSGAWSETAVTPKRSTDINSNATIVEGGVWHTATFEDLWFTTNGASFVFKTPAHPSAILAEGLTVATLCASNDRLALAGLAGDWFSGSRWMGLFETWRRTRRGFAHDQMTWSPRMAIWGERRGGAHDMPFWPLLVALGVFGEDAFDAMQAKFITAIEQGEIGFASVRNPGTPQVMKPLGGDIVVYSKEGRVFLRPEEAGPGYIPMLDDDSGVSGRGALSAGPTRHAWITPARRLSAQAVSGPVADLNHQHRFTGSLAALVSSYDKAAKEHWFATPNWAYLLNNYGLGGPMDVRPTSLCRADGALVGPGANLNLTQVDVEFYSHLVDMGYRGAKTITVVETTQHGLSNHRIDVKAATANETPFSLGAVQANEMGAGFARRNGNEFMVGDLGKGAVGGSYGIGKRTVRYQSDDRRARRGTVGAPGNS